MGAPPKENMTKEELILHTVNGVSAHLEEFVKEYGVLPKHIRLIASTDNEEIGHRISVGNFGDCGCVACMARDFGAIQTGIIKSYEDAVELAEIVVGSSHGAGAVKH